MRQLIMATENYELWETSPGRFSIYSGGRNIRSNLTYAEALRWWSALTAREGGGEALRLPAGSRGVGRREVFDVDVLRARGGTERDRAMREIETLSQRGFWERV